MSQIVRKVRKNITPAVPMHRRRSLAAVVSWPLKRTEYMLATVLSLFLVLAADSSSVRAQELNHCDSVCLCLKGNWDSLEVDCLRGFFGAFSDERCLNNVEWGEGTNELLFRLMDEKPRLFFSALFGLNKRQRAAVKEQIDNPLSDGIPIRDIYAHVRQAKMPSVLKKKSLRFLRDTLAKETKMIESWERHSGKKWQYPTWP